MAETSQEGKYHVSYFYYQRRGDTSVLRFQAIKYHDRTYSESGDVVFDIYDPSQEGEEPMAELRGWEKDEIFQARVAANLSRTEGSNNYPGLVEAAITHLVTTQYTTWIFDTDVTLLARKMHNNLLRNRLVRPVKKWKIIGPTIGVARR